MLREPELPLSTVCSNRSVLQILDVIGVGLWQLGGYQVIASVVLSELS